MWAIFNISKGLLFEESTNKKVFNFFKLSIETFDFFIVIFFDRMDLFTHVPKFGDLIFNFILELGCEIP